MAAAQGRRPLDQLLARERRGRLGAGAVARARLWLRLNVLNRLTVFFCPSALATFCSNGGQHGDLRGETERRRQRGRCASCPGQNPQSLTARPNTHRPRPEAPRRVLEGRFSGRKSAVWSILRGPLLSQRAPQDEVRSEGYGC